MVTNTQLQRIQDDWQVVVGTERIRVTYSKGDFEVVCSELASLKLYRHYNGAGNTAQGYSKNLKAFYFLLETNL